ncbi:MAG: AMP-binding protein [Caldilineaceae bacterium]
MSNSLSFPKTEIEQSIIARWQRIVALFPAAPAVTTPTGEQYSYQQVEACANQLAHTLLAHLGANSCVVALLIDHTPLLITSIMGVLKANKTYVVLNPTQSREQLQLLCALSDAPLLVTTPERQAVAETIVTPAQTIINLANLNQTTEHSAKTAPLLPISPDAPAALFFTSGSVRQPKGVVYTHRLILHRIWVETELYQLTNAERISGLRSFDMAASLRDLFNALLTGGTLCLYALQQHALNDLSPWLLQQKITYFHLPILLYRQWLDTLRVTDTFPAIRYIFPSGRKSEEDFQRVWQHLAPTACFVSTYGSTETSLLTQVMMDRQTPVAHFLLSVGQATPDKTILLLDEQAHPVPEGQVGEVVVRSRYIATGYWRQPELSAQRFQVAQDDSGLITYWTGDLGRQRSDGSLELMGRQDSQVKLRGYRVVLEEVEDALRSLSSVQEAAVTADEERGLLYVYVIAAVQPPPLASALRTALTEKLPYYALPTHIVFLPSFPLLPSGKVNRRALPTPEFNREGLTTPYVPPQTALEATLTTLWEEVLAVEPIGMLDHFLELGGSSLRAMRLMVAIERRLGVQMSLATFFACPTISHQAQTLNQAESTTPAITADQSIDPATHPVRSPEQEQAFQRIYREIGQPDAVQSWLQPHEARWRPRRKDMQALLGRLPYRLAVAWLAWSVQQRQVQGRYYRKEVADVQQFLPTIGRTAQDRQPVADYLFFGAWAYYRLTPWGNHPEKLRATETRAWVDVRGMGLVEQAVAEGRGLILLRSHSNGDFWFNTLPIQSYRLRQLERQLEIWQLNDTLTQSTLFAHQLNTARQVLEKGGIVNVHADGRHGYSQGRLYNFLGRQRSFHTSFAELALLTGAKVVAVDVTLHRNGRATLTFVDPFDPGATHEAYSQRVERLVNQYVAFCQAKWTSEPWSIPWYQLAWHLDTPLWEDELPLRNKS